MEVSSAQVRFSAAAMTMSSGVTDGLVRYLCLKIAVPEIEWLKLQPEFPAPIVFGGCAKDICLFAVFCVGSMFV
jgi:hypothetical protein